MDSTTKSQLEIAIQACNIGIDHLSSRDFDSAIASFSSSLRLAKQIICEQDNCNITPEQNECSLPVRSSLLDRCMEGSSKLYKTCRTHQEGYIFHHAIRFIAPSNLSEEFANINNYEDLNYFISTIAVVLSTLVVYNLALAYQLSANAEGASSPAAKLRKALKLYELAFSFQKIEHMTDSIMFTMAILNNLGLIHKQLGDEESSRICFEQLLSTIMFIVDYRRGGDVDNHDQNSLEGFLENTSNVINKTRTAPAA